MPFFKVGDFPKMMVSLLLTKCLFIVNTELEISCTLEKKAWTLGCPKSRYVFSYVPYIFHRLFYGIIDVSLYGKISILCSCETFLVFTWKNWVSLTFT